MKFCEYGGANYLATFRIKKGYCSVTFKGSAPDNIKSWLYSAANDVNSALKLGYMPQQLYLDFNIKDGQKTYRVKTIDRKSTARLVQLQNGTLLQCTDGVWKRIDVETAIALIKES